MNLVQMGILGSELIVFTALVRMIGKKYLPKSCFLLLWEFSALRLLLPISIPLPFGFLRSEAVFGQSGAFSAQTNSIAKLPDAPIQTVTVTSENQSEILYFLWLAGSVLAAAYFFVCFVISVRKFKISLPDRTPYVQQWMSQQTACRKIEVRVSDRITSPLTYGVIHPVILLPAQMEREDESLLRSVLLHEQIHIKRFDAAAKMLFTAALCVHWWNPAVWLMIFLANRDMELSCDAAVIRKLGKEYRTSYALALIAMEEKRSVGASLQSCFSKNIITERVETIMKFKKTSVAAMIAAVAITMAGTMTAFAAAPEKEENPPKLAAQEIMGIEQKEGTGKTYSNDGKDIPFAEKIDPKDGWEIENKGMAGIEDVSQKPPLMIPQDFRQAVLRGEVEPFTLKEGETAEIIDAEGNREVYKEALNEEDLKNAELYRLVPESVSHADESKFTPEEWKEILKKIDEGTMHWED